jgi:hypothetical protein
LPLDLFDQRKVGDLRDVYVLFDVAGLSFKRDQPLDRLGLNARVLAEKRSGEVIRLLRDVFVHLEQPRDHVDAFLPPLADEAERFDLRADDPLVVLVNLWPGLKIGLDITHQGRYAESFYCRKLVI